MRIKRIQKINELREIVLSNYTSKKFAQRVLKYV